MGRQQEEKMKTFKTGIRYMYTDKGQEVYRLFIESTDNTFHWNFYIDDPKSVFNISEFILASKMPPSVKFKLLGSIVEHKVEIFEYQG